MLASQLWYLEIVHSSLKHSFASCYLLKVSGMFWNTPKLQFGCNGVEWMLHNFSTSKQCIQSQNTSFVFFHLSKVSEMLRNKPKHHFGSNGVKWMLHNFRIETQVLIIFTCRRLAKCSETLPNITLGPMGQNGCFTSSVPRNSVFRLETQVLLFFTSRRLAKCSKTLWNIILCPMEQNGCFTTLIPRNNVFSPETQVLHLFPVEGCWNALKHAQTSFWVQWSRMDASQLRYLETVHSSRNTCFASFYLSKVSEMLRNTPKHHFGSNGVEWMLHNFGTSKQCIGPETHVLHLFTCRRLVKCYETLPNITLGPME
jgi:hypothetical protein